MMRMDEVSRRKFYDERDKRLSFISSLDGQQLDAEASRVLGSEVLPYSSDMGAAWKLREWIAQHETWSSVLSDFTGPNFKPENKYMTSEGYPLGTIIWYTRVDAGLGRFQYFFGDNGATALTKGFLAVHWAVENTELLKSTW